MHLEFCPAWKEQSRLGRQINREAWNRGQEVPVWLRNKSVSRYKATSTTHLPVKSTPHPRPPFPPALIYLSKALQLSHLWFLYPFCWPPGVPLPVGSQVWLELKAFTSFSHISLYWNTVTFSLKYTKLWLSG